MSRAKKTFTVVLWVTAVVSMLGVLALKTLPGRSDASPADPTPRVMYDSPAFSLTDQDNHNFSSKQLSGHPWVADFVFTTCTTVCPRMSQHMADLQKKIPTEVKLVSFSVDPEHDTPAMMAEYLQNYHAEPGRWMMLSSDVKTQAHVVSAMKLHFAPAAENQPIQHDSHFVLVDGEGHIRGYYESDDRDAVDHLIRDVNYLLAHPPAGGK